MTVMPRCYVRSVRMLLAVRPGAPRSVLLVEMALCYVRSFLLLVVRPGATNVASCSFTFHLHDVDLCPPSFTFVQIRARVRMSGTHPHLLADLERPDERTGATWRPKATKRTAVGVIGFTEND